MAEENTVLLTEKAYGEIKNLKSINTRKVGSFLFKNIPDAVTVYAITDHGLAFPSLKTTYHLRVDQGHTTDQKNLLSPDEEFLIRVNEVIGDNLSNTQLSVEFLAHEIGLSRPQLYRNIRALTQQSPNDLIRETRLQTAAKLLKMNTGNVSEIAYQTGFNNLSYFSKSFQDRFGHTPSEYAKNNKSHFGIPAPLNQFIGRRKEMEEIMEIIRQVRLLTLTGPGGSGKSRLALEIMREFGRDFRDGVHFVQLAPVSSAREVLPKVAQVLKIQQDLLKETLPSIIQFIDEKDTLLLLDNFEHVMEAAGDLSTLLAACPNLKIMVTSRNVLNVTGEHEYQVPQLPVPLQDKIYSITELITVPAVELFINRAQSVKPGYQLDDSSKMAVSEICRQLDGLPLAIELAAARIKIFSPQALMRRLANNLDILTSNSSDRPDRHRTLKNAIDWSYSLLSPVEQTLFRRLSVFRGGCTLEAAEAVCFPDYSANSDILEIVTGLIDKSLLQSEDQPDGEPRFYLLETIKLYGQEKLQKSLELEAIMDNYVTYFSQLIHDAEKHLTGSDQGIWLDYLERELDNVRTVLTWLENRGDAQLGLKLAVSSWRYWTIRSMMREGAEWLKRMLDIPAENKESIIRCKALNAYGIMLGMTQGIVDALATFQESLAVARKIDYREGIGQVLNHLAWVHQFRAEYDICITYSREALQIHETINNKRGLAATYNNMAFVALERGNLEDALKYFSKGAFLMQSIGDQRGYAYNLIYAAWVHMYLGEYEAADQKTTESIQILTELSDKQLIAFAFSIKAYNLFYMQKLNEAASYIATAKPLWELSGNLQGRITCEIVESMVHYENADFILFESALAHLLKRSVTDLVWRQPIYLIGYLQSKWLLFNGMVEEAYDKTLDNLKAIINHQMDLIVVDYLELLAQLLLNKENVQEAIRIFALSAKLRELHRINIPPVWASSYNKLYEELRGALDPDQFQQLWEEGRVLECDQILLLV